MSSQDFAPQGEARSSVKISTTAAGKPLVEVKVYDGADQAEVTRIQRLAVETYRETAASLGVPV